jgi:KDO2-lipid IV(A) lauroyltransferase
MGAIRGFYKRSPRLRQGGRYLKNQAIALAARTALGLGRRLSLERGLRLADRLGVLLYHLLRQPRQIALANLEMVFGERSSPAGRERLARAAFMNVARCFIELVQIDAIRERADEYVEIVGWENVEACLAAGRGVIAVTGHIGNWELLAAACAWRGAPVAAVARRIYVPELNQLLVDFRQRQGVETILRESPMSARQILRAIKRNAILAMLIDQDTNVPSVSVPFLGHLARTPAAAAALALRRDLPILMASIGRRPNGGHRLTLRAPLHPNHSADLQADIRALTAHLNRVLEAQILENPAEWVWWHRRWRNPPKPHLDLDGEFQYTAQDAVLRSGGTGGV